MYANHNIKAVRRPYITLVTLLKDLDGKVTAINEDVDTRDKIKHLEQILAACTRY